MRYPSEFIERVQEANNLVDIISQYTQLKQSGNGYMGRCPFPDHMEKTASFSVSEAKQVYHCFGCKKSGNIFSFLRDYNGMAFPDAIEYLAERVSIPLPEIIANNNDQFQQQQGRKRQMLKVNKLASEFFQETLKRTSADHPIKNYIHRRKLKSETIQEFQIGFAPSEWDSLSNYFHRQRVSLQVAEEAKLIKARKEGNGHFDLFRDRLMFPILSPSGEVLAFGGRIHDQGEPKYLNSPETLVFNKGRVLYGLTQTAKYIRSEDYVVIVEGYMDLVSLFQAGIKNVAATMGTALTADHAKLVKRITNNVVVLFDGDEAGQKAAERSLPLLLAAGLYPKGLILTEAKDPDEYIAQYGVELLQKRIQEAPELFNAVVHSWMKDYRGEASEKVKLIDQIKPIFDAIPDNRLKILYAQELAARMNVTFDWVRSSLSTGSKSKDLTNFRSNEGLQKSQDQSNFQADSQVLHAPKPLFLVSRASQAELLLLQLSLKSRANFQIVIDQQILSQINDLGVKSLLEKAEQVYRQDLNKFDKLTSLLIEFVDQPDLLFVNSNSSAAVPVGMFDEEKENKLIQDAIKKIREDFLDGQIMKIRIEMKQNPDPEKLKEIADLKKKIVSLNK